MNLNLCLFVPHFRHLTYAQNKAMDLDQLFGLKVHTTQGKERLFDAMPLTCSLWGGYLQLVGGGYSGHFFSQQESIDAAQVPFSHKVESKLLS